MKLNLIEDVLKRLHHKYGWRRHSQLDSEIHSRLDKKLLLDLGTGPNKAKIIKNYDPRWLITLDFDKNFKPTVSGDATCLPFRDSCIEAVRCLSLLEHVYKYEKVIDEIKRVLQPAGAIEVQVPFIWEYHPYPEDYFRFSHVALKRLFEEKGFLVIIDKEYSRGFFCTASLIFEFGASNFRSIILKLTLAGISFLLNRLVFLDRLSYNGELYASVVILAIKR